MFEGGTLAPSPVAASHFQSVDWPFVSAFSFTPSSAVPTLWGFGAQLSGFGRGAACGRRGFLSALPGVTHSTCNPRVCVACVCVFGEHAHLSLRAYLWLRPRVSMRLALHCSRLRLRRIVDTCGMCTTPLVHVWAFSLSLTL